MHLLNAYGQMTLGLHDSRRPSKPPGSSVPSRGRFPAPWSSYAPAACGPRLGARSRAGSRSMCSIRSRAPRCVSASLPGAFALLETTGRHRGRLRQTPIGGGFQGSSFWLVAEHGMGCGYVQNLVAHPAVRLKVGRQCRSGSRTFETAVHPLAG